MRARGLIWVMIAAVLLAAAAPACAAGPAGYQLDPSHTGFASGATLKPPLGKRWVRRDLGVTSFPVMAEGRVYVSSGGNVYALGAHGRTVWSRSLESAGLAYDAGRLFTVGPRGAVEALSAATGKVLWVTDLSADYYGPPTAYGDFVYVADSQSVHGIRQDTGIPVWDTEAATENLAPAVDSGKVYSGGDCGSSALQRTVGVEEWRYSNCGVGRYPPAVYGGRVYAGGAVLDTLTGTLRDTYSASNTPAFAGGTGYFEAGNELFARDAASGVVRWRYRTSEDGFRTPPVVAGGYVYAVTAGGKLIAVSRARGRRATCTRGTSTRTAPGGSPPPATRSSSPTAGASSDTATDRTRRASTTPTSRVRRPECSRCRPAGSGRGTATP
jgi:outer membrane protein assembly factor BamB